MVTEYENKTPLIPETNIVAVPSIRNIYLWSILMPFLLFSRPGVPCRPGQINYVRCRPMTVGPQHRGTYNF